MFVLQTWGAYLIQYLFSTAPEEIFRFSVLFDSPWGEILIKCAFPLSSAAPRPRGEALIQVGVFQLFVRQPFSDSIVYQFDMFITPTAK